jgi:hypothetical protein
MHRGKDRKALQAGKVREKQASSRREPHIFANNPTTVLGIFLTSGTLTVQRLKRAL